MVPSRLSAAVLSAGVLLAAAPAAAAGGWMAGGEIVPIEQRIAAAVGPSRTVTWTSLRYRGGAPVALVIPAAKGAVVDLASDAWFEALEANTAPRILPPSQSDACPGSAPTVGAVEVVGNFDHRVTMPPAEIAVLASAAAVDAWANDHQLYPSGSLDTAMRALAPSHFVAVLFPATHDGGTTATLRITSEAPHFEIPLAMTHAGTEDLLVTTFLLGEGRAALAPETPALLPPAKVAWFPAIDQSNYVQMREDVLTESSEATLTESAGHAGLANDASIAFDLVQIESAIRAYYERGLAYGGAGDPEACVAAATSALAATAPVSTICAPGSLGAVGAAASCDPSTPPGTTAADALRCGDGLDDLALALDGMHPAAVWLTRESLFVEAMHPGVDLALSYPGGPQVSNVVAAGRLDLAGCSESPGGGIGHGSGNGNGSGSNGGVNVSSGGGVDLGSIDAGGCDGSDSAGDDCGGGDAGGDDCDGGGGDSCDTGGGDDCSGGSGAGSCDCTFGAPKKKPRGSILLMTTVAIAALLRRRGSNKRRAAKA